MADTSRSVDILINGRDAATPAINSSESALRRLEERLHATKSSLRGFNEILGLAFGFGVGRKVFEQLHEGIVSLGEGFIEARNEGESFFSSLEQGFQKMLGMKTTTEVLKETMKESAEFAKEFTAALEHAERFRRGLPITPELQYPNTKPAGQADTIERELRDALKKAQDAAKRPDEELYKAISDAIARRELEPHYFKDGRYVPQKFGSSFSAGVFGSLPDLEKSGPEEVRKRYAKQFADREQASNALQKFLVDAEAADAKAAKDAVTRAEFVKNLKSLVLGGGTLTGNDTTAAYFRRIETLAAGTLGGGIGSATASASPIFSFLYRAITGGAKAQTFEREMDDLDRKRPAEIIQTPRSTDTHPGLVAENQRMLTRFGGENVSEKQLKVQEKMLTAIDNQTKKINDLTKKFYPTGIVQKF